MGHPDLYPIVCLEILYPPKVAWIVGHQDAVVRDRNARNQNIKIFDYVPRISQLRLYLAEQLRRFAAI